MVDKSSSSGAQTQTFFQTLFVIIALVALVGIVFLVVLRSQADDVSQSVTVANSDPTIDSHTTATSSGGIDAATFTLTENTTTDLFWHGSVTDNNSCLEVDDETVNWLARFYRSNVSGTIACSADNDDCYVPTPASDITLTNCTGASDVSLDWEVTDSVQYYADATDANADTYSATDWTTYVAVTDDNAGTDSSSDTIEVATVWSLNLDGAINFGSIAFSDTSAEQTLVVSNTGNEAIDYDIKVDADMTCTSGTIAAGNVEYSLSSGFTYGVGGTDLTTSNVGVDSSIAKATSAGASSDDLYLLLQMPSNGVAGSCSNTLTVTAKDNA